MQYQSAGSKEVDGMIEMHSAPGLLRQPPWVICQFWRLALVLCTCCADAAQLLDIIIDVCGL